MHPQRVDDRYHNEDAVKHPGHDCPETEITIAEQAEVNDRVRLISLPDQKKEDRAQAHGKEGTHDRRCEPIELVAAVEGKLDTDNAHNHGGEPDPVYRLLCGGRLSILEKAVANTNTDHSHRHIDVKNPGPAEIVSNKPAQYGPHNGRNRSGEPPDSQRHTVFFGRINPQQEGL